MAASTAISADVTTASMPGRLPGQLLKPRAMRPAVLYFAAGTAAIGIYFLLPPNPRDVLYVAIGLSAVAAVFVGSWRLESGRLAWNLFALGLLANVIADAISSYYEM